MGRSALVVVIALACVLALSSCGSTTSEPVDISQNDNGSVQELAVGQDLRITLEANPTTGYQWVVDGQVPDQLEQAGEPEYAAESTLVGAGGKEVWTFSGKATGKDILRLKYWRSFEPTAEPEATFSVTVDVK